MLSLSKAKVLATMDFKSLESLLDPDNIKTSEAELKRFAEAVIDAWPSDPPSHAEAIEDVLSTEAQGIIDDIFKASESSYAADARTYGYVADEFFSGEVHSSSARDVLAACLRREVCTSTGLEFLRVAGTFEGRDLGPYTQYVFTV